MKRRNFLAACAAATLQGFAPAHADVWQARLIKGTVSPSEIWLGLHIQMQPQWKTYWRVPGVAGIPPMITVAAKGKAGQSVFYPVPRRFEDAGGEAIGYQQDVLFPILLKGSDLSAVSLNAFFGICHDICRPAKFSATMEQAIDDAALISTWQSKLPQPGNFIEKAQVQSDVLHLSLTQTVEDIFVMGPDGTYFNKPQITGRSAAIKIDGLQPGQSLSGEALTCTGISATGGLEQRLTIA